MALSPCPSRNIAAPSDTTSSICVLSSESKKQRGKQKEKSQLIPTGTGAKKLEDPKDKIQYFYAVFWLDKVFISV